MKPKLWIFTTFAMLFVIALLHTFVISLWYKSPNTWIYNAMTKKHSLASAVQKPKILLVGGSNVLFGLKAKMIQNEFDIATCNMGVNAGLEIDYIIEDAKRYLKPLDSVILVPEYEHFVKTKTLNTLRVEYILHYDRPYFDKLNLQEKLRYLWSIGADEFLMSFFATKKERNYNSATIDNFGDETAHHDPKIITNFTQGSHITPALTNPTFSDSYGLQSIVAFAKWCKQNQITLYLSWPSTIKFATYDTPAYQKYFADLTSFFAKNNIRLLGKPQDFLYQKEFFYDTNYHLNEQSAKIRTAKLIELLYNQAKSNPPLEHQL